MKHLKTIAMAVLATWAVQTHAANSNELDSTIQAAYQCKAQGVKGNVALHVMYGIKNGQAVVAQAKLSNGALSGGLWADNANQPNTFASRDADGTIWTTAPSNGNNIHRVDGGTLSVRQNGQNAVVLDKCKLDPSTTAKLNSSSR